MVKTINYLITKTTNKIFALGADCESALRVAQSPLYFTKITCEGFPPVGIGMQKIGEGYVAYINTSDRKGVLKTKEKKYPTLKEMKFYEWDNAGQIMGAFADYVINYVKRENPEGKFSVGLTEETNEIPEEFPIRR